LSGRVIALCEKHWQQHRADCSGLLKAVAGDLGIPLTGQANEIIDTLSGNWTSITDGAEAARLAAEGKFVVGGLKAMPNGHVVVVVEGQPNRGRYPRAYWGRLRSVGMKNETINWSWNTADRDKVVYFYCDIP
jgi:hypothetical protein